MVDIITRDPSLWLLQVLYNANKTDTETYRIYKTYIRYFNDNREFIGVTDSITPSVSRHKPLNDLADDCLFGVTFFKRTIRRKRDRYGAPGVKFYTNAGKSAFESIGYPMISANWEFWVSYVNTNIQFNK